MLLLLVGGPSVPQKIRHCKLQAVWERLSFWVDDVRKSSLFKLNLSEALSYQTACKSKDRLIFIIWCQAMIVWNKIYDKPVETFSRYPKYGWRTMQNVRSSSLPLLSLALSSWDVTNMPYFLSPKCSAFQNGRSFTTSGNDLSKGFIYGLLVGKRKITAV